MASGALLQEMKQLTDEAEASEIVMLQGFNWESHKAGKGNWYGIVESKARGPACKHHRFEAEKRLFRASRDVLGLGKTLLSSVSPI